MCHVVHSATIHGVTLRGFAIAYSSPPVLYYFFTRYKTNIKTPKYNT